jgi:hypothetical protein
MPCFFANRSETRRFFCHPPRQYQPSGLFYCNHVFANMFREQQDGAIFETGIHVRLRLSRMLLISRHAHHALPVRRRPFSGLFSQKGSRWRHDLTFAKFSSPDNTRAPDIEQLQVHVFPYQNGIHPG